MPQWELPHESVKDVENVGAESGGVRDAREPKLVGIPSRPLGGGRYIRSDVSLLQVDLRDFRKTMDVKLDALDKKFEGKVDALDKKFDAKFDTLNGKVDGLTAKIGELKVWALLVIGGGGLNMIGHALHWF